MAENVNECVYAMNSSVRMSDIIAGCGEVPERSASTTGMQSQWNRTRLPCHRLPNVDAANTSDNSSRYGSDSRELRFAVAN